MSSSKSISDRAGNAPTRRRSKPPRRSALLLTLLTLLTAGVGFAQEEEPSLLRDWVGFTGGRDQTPPGELPEDELPEDQRERWRVELLGVYTRGVDRELVAVATGIPQIFLQGLEAVETHRLGSAERRAIAEGVLEDRYDAALLRRNELQDEMDRVYFSGAGALEQEEELRRLKEELREQEKLLAMIRGTSADRVDVVPEKPVEVTTAEEPRYSPVYDLRSWAEESEADLLIYGELDRSANYLFLTVYEYNYHLDRERELGRTAARAEELARNLGRLVRNAQDSVAGRPVAPLTVRLTGYRPQEGEVFVDDSSRGFGSVNIPLLPVGTAQVRVEHPATAPIVRNVRVSNDGENSVEFAIPDPEHGYVAVVSEPPGASIYIDSLWQGTTPYMVERPPNERQIRLSLTDYYDSQFVITPESPNLINRELLPESLRWEEEIERTKDVFYRSFGAFILSLPFPIILNGVYANLTTLFPEEEPRSGLSQEEAQRRLSQADAVFYSYYTSLGLSIGLFGHMLYRLVNYIRTGEEYHSR